MRLYGGGVLFDENIRRAEDIDFNARVFANANRALYLPQAFYHYQRHGNNATERFRLSDLGEAEVWRRLERLVANRPDLIEGIQMRKAWMVFYFAGLNALDPGTNNHFRAWHPEHFKAIQHEAAQIPNFLNRLSAEQRDLYLQLCALYERQRNKEQP